ncbi:pterin-4-alpha-carbinolamine dehydratase 2 [Favolaschia claudopus]|uniref:4a-hydroxytetrahydrobiopterin dehydratase n=1 Tax=Favolaschia claudopus TaxID=2862362 RepID=A0AAW0C0P6_9AGAR
MFTLRYSRRLRAVEGRRLFSDVLFPVPPRAKGWPTPWITEADAAEYLFPLYSQGWYITAVSSDLPTVKTAGLACRFTFESCSPAATFIKEVLTLTETEKHHPSWLKLMNSGENASVQICSTTHSALRPEWNSSDTPESRVLQGITLRDLRFAALVSSLPSNTFKPGVEIGPSRTRPTWEELCATLQFWATPSPSKDSAKGVQQSTSSDEIRGPQKKNTSTCPACGGPHILNACPTRHTISPPPCPICSGSHWRIDCPVTKAARRSNKTISQIKSSIVRSDNPPQNPCPNCGGDHWKEDCRVPQAPSQLLDELKLSVPNVDPFAPSTETSSK